MIIVLLLFLLLLGLVGMLAVGSLRAPSGSLARRSMAAGAFVVAALVVLSVAPMLNPRMQPLEPDLPFLLGARADADDLVVWVGARCEDAESFKVTVSVREPRRSVSLRLESDEPTTLEGPLRVRDLQEDPPGSFEVVERWPDQIDLADFDAISVLSPGAGAQAPVDVVVEGSAEHPGEFWFGDDLGWMDLDEAAARDGEDFYSLCRTDIRYE